MQDRARMRIKGDGSGDGTKGTSSFYHRPHDQLMPKMQPIKNTKGQHGRALDFGVVGAVKEAHKLLPISNCRFPICLFSTHT